MRRHLFSKVVPAVAAVTLLWSSANAAIVNVGDASGEPGQTVALDVSLDSQTDVVAGLEGEIGFGAGVAIAAKTNGRPDCTVNPDISKEATAFSFQPSGCTGAACLRVKALVLSLGNVDPILTGSRLFTCNVVIASDATPQSTAPLMCTNARSSDPDGVALTTTCTDGAVAIGGVLPTPTEGPPAVTIVIGSAEGQPGTTVGVNISLDTMNLGDVAGAENEVTFAAARILAKTNGRPDCLVNPDINKEATAFSFQPSGCTGDACLRVKALVLSLGNVDPIPNGATMYTCQVGIPSNATPGQCFPLTCSAPRSSDPDGVAVDTVCTDGEVCVPSPTPTEDVTRTPTSTATNSPTRTDTPRPPNVGGDEDDGCQIAAPANSNSGWLLLIPVAGLLWFRRRSR